VNSTPRDSNDPESEISVRSIDAVIFDFGGVLASNGRPSDVVRRFPNDPADVVMRVMMGEYGQDTDHPWHRLERGEISMADYRSALAPLVMDAGLTPVATTFAPEPGQSIPFDFTPNAPVVELVHELRDAGFRLGVLTNNVRELRERWWPMLDFPRLFHDVVDSHEVGMRKPNPSIYRLALERLGVPAHRTAFLDDAESNVRAAIDVGLHGVLVDEDPTTAVSTVRLLANL
jgi:epoxide hydrolase-like predicted phosphatase